MKEIMNNLTTSLDFAKEICDSIMSAYSPQELPPAGRFHYHQGVFLLGMGQVYDLCKDEKYIDYIKQWVDNIIDDNGKVTCYDDTELDDKQAGSLLVRLYEITADIRYKKALNELLEPILSWKKTTEGGLLHKHNMPYVMLDGIYMYGPLSVNYGANFNHPEYFDIVWQQLKMMYDKMRDNKTGVLYHAYDCDKKLKHSSPETGLSMEFWGRAMGWYAAALVDILDNLPEDYIHRQEIVDIEKDFLEALSKFQHENGLWYQVVDKNDREDNWSESSCSCLFVYAICKAISMGILSSEFKKIAQKGYEGIKTMLKDGENGLELTGICIGTGVCDYQGYIERPVSTNDLHGAGAFALMCCEYYKLFGN